ncbi:thiamine phosphate synthase [Jeotgalibacillus sp. R-1-5s-1]|uniref:thiamine phosphate synthase n=1 Tax=Jeotgalibacillus sp. R-1-5s-1 TaxID=2555897 RepID=UPI00106B5CC3|nr:thiamine phosphate synthase [Jeotgalibacillus sp. R-1-5s-1]TFE00033.1 thiamine phosphate synthase [Jeotgalibacillus sp. R-1-5s-1]
MDATTLRRYFILGSQNCRGENPLSVLNRAIESGITAFQYREKGQGSLHGKKKIELGLALREMCRTNGIPFFINDDVELAQILDVDGIHIGQEDEKPNKVRERFPDLVIGLSVSNEHELANSSLEGVDYIGAGPIFATNTKSDAKTPTGTEWIRKLKQQHPHLPVVGIGGIHAGNAKKVLSAGADGVAFITAVFDKDVHLL